VSDVLCHKRGPDGDHLEWAAASCHLEAHAARVFVAEDAERMQVSRMRRLPEPTLDAMSPESARKRERERERRGDIPAKLHIFAGLKKIVQAVGHAMLVLPLHGNDGAVEEHHACSTVLGRLPRLRILRYLPTFVQGESKPCPQIKLAVLGIHLAELQARLGTQ